MIMNIENPDALRVWLSSTLAPICDADPAALAKYVMALLKKDKSEQELKDFCAEQLDVFLQKETKPFVDKLFSVIKDRSYLTAPSKSTSSAAPEVSPVAAVSSSSTHKSPGSTTDSPSSVRGSDRGPSGSGRSDSGGGRPVRSSSRSGRKRSPSPSAHRSSDHRASRSRSKERNAASGSSRGGGGGGDRRHDQRQPSKEHPRRDTDKENRSNRSRKSPVPVQTPSSSSGTATASDTVRTKGSSSTRKSERGDSDSSIDGDKPDKKRKKLRCRDFDEQGFCMRGDLCPYDHGPDPVVVDDIALPTMISITAGGSAAKPPSTPGGTPNFSVPPPGYGTAPPGVHPPPPGMDTVPSYQQPEGYNPEAPSISVAVPPPGYNRPPPPSAVGSSTAPRHPPPIWTQQPPPSLYLPPTIPGGAPGSQLPPVPLPVPLPSTMIVQRPGAPAGRDLITLADTADAMGPRTVVSAPMPMPSTIPFRPAMGGKRPFGMGPGGLGMQMGPRGSAPYDKSNCTLEVRRIPSHLNTISKLNEHFSQFGQVVNMQVRYENDPEAALVTYANRQQAVAAYKSTAPILNNRFIKIFWHDKEAAAEAGASGSGNASTIPGKPSIKDRLGAPSNLQGHQAGSSGDSMKYRAPPPTLDEDGNHRAVVLSTSGNLTRTIYNPEALAAATSQKGASVEKSGSGSEPTTPPSPSATAQKPGFQQPKSQPPPMVHPKMRKQQKLQEAMKKSLELQKAKADLLKKQVEQQKLLLAQLEKCNNPTQKKEIIKTIKMLEKTIKAMTEDLAKAAKQSAIPKVKTKEALEKEMLDTELELIRQKQSGGDTSELQRHLTDLRLDLTAFLARSSSGPGMERKSLGTGAPVQSMGGQPMRKRRAMPETAVLDKRPRDLVISGFQADEKDALIEHLQHYGMLEDIEFHHTKGDHQACRATVIYKTRREAETALANGAEFRNRELTIQWAHQRTASVSDSTATGSAAGASAESAPNTEMTAEEILASLDDDEDEEEDDGDREREEDEDEDERGDDDEDEPTTGGGAGDWKRATQ